MQKDIDNEDEYSSIKIIQIVLDLSLNKFNIILTNSTSDEAITILKDAITHLKFQKPLNENRTIN